MTQAPGTPAELGLEEVLARIADQLANDGILLEDAVDQATQTVSSELRASARRIATSVAEDVAETVAKVDADLAEFREGLKRDWGPALDLMLATISFVEGLADRFDRRTGPRDPLGDALTGLTASALRTTREAHCLLREGLPMGALARARTVHELAVTADVLGRFGRLPEHADLGERFLSHRVVMRYKEARTYQDCAPRLGAPLLEETTVEQLEEAANALIGRWGSEYRNQYGWAAAIVGNPSPRFADLELLAELDHMRGHFTWASHFVHADSRGDALNRIRRGDEITLLTGMQNIALAEPGSMALHALGVCLQSVLDHGSVASASVIELAGSLAAVELVKEFDRLGSEAEATIAAREAALYPNDARSSSRS